MSLAAGPVLLTTVQQTSTTALLVDCALRRGMEHVVTAGRPADLAAALAGRSVHWYGGPLAADRITARCELGLLEPPEGWLSELPEEFTGRRITLATLSDAWTARSPVFVKQPTDKNFPAAVYADGTRLPRTGERIGANIPVLVCEVVTFAVEYRLFVLDGRIVTGSRYARYGRLDVAPLHGEPHEAAVRDFAEALLAAARSSLPSAVVVDVGLIQDPDTGRERWAVMEANMPWFAHSYAADPDGGAGRRVALGGPARPPLGERSRVCAACRGVRVSFRLWGLSLHSPGVADQVDGRQEWRGWCSPATLRTDIPLSGISKTKLASRAPASNAHCSPKVSCGSGLQGHLATVSAAVTVS